MFRVKFKVNTDRAAQVELERRLRLMGGAAAQAVTKNVTEAVKSRIPSGGWYDIYKAAITYFATPDGAKWAVSGQWETKFTSFPAETTLLTFSGNSDIANALIQFNPWTVDQLPAINGGYRATVVAKPASPGAVEDRRKILIGAIEKAKETLTKAGATLAPGFPEVNGKVYADIAYMAVALEHGLAGLARVPHWIVAYNVARQKMGQWTDEARGKIQAILDGNADFVSDAPQMPPELERALEPGPGRSGRAGNAS